MSEAIVLDALGRRNESSAVNQYPRRVDRNSVMCFSLHLRRKTSNVVVEPFFQID